MNELISKSIDRHKRNLLWMILVTNLAIIFGNYMDSMRAIDDKSLAGNTWLVIAIVFSNLIIFSYMSHFLKKVLCDLFYDLEKKQPGSVTKISE
jgi:hypothetical protein